MKNYSEPELIYRSFKAESIVTASADMNGDSIQMVLDEIGTVNGQVVVNDLKDLNELF